MGRVRLARRLRDTGLGGGQIFEAEPGPPGLNVVWSGSRAGIEVG